MTPFINANGLPEIDLAIDTLVALYRLDPNSVLRRTLPSLLEIKSSESAKLISVGACWTLVKDQGLSAFPSTNLLLSVVSKHLRNIFLEACSTLSTSQPKMNDTSRRRSSLLKYTPPIFKNNSKDSLTTELSLESNLLLMIVEIWTRDLRFLTSDIENEEEGFSKIILNVVKVLLSGGEGNESLSKRAAIDLLLELNRSEIEEVGRVRDGEFGKLALQVTAGICRLVIEWTEDQLALELLNQDLMRYQAFFQAAPVRLSFFTFISQYH